MNFVGTNSCFAGRDGRARACALTAGRLTTRVTRIVAALAVAYACGACATGGGASGERTSMAPAADSITLALYHLDDVGGQHCTDDGPYRLNGTAGRDSRTDFGRIGSARSFSSSNESWVFVPYARDMNSRHLTVEAWISPQLYSSSEDSPIAGRWGEYANEQSWLFSLVGLRRWTRLTAVATPGFHETLVAQGAAGHLMFAFQPAEPVPPVVFFSTNEITLERWTHVAVTHDGEIVRFYINGQLDSQYATQTTIRDSQAPLLVGNYIDTRSLSSFSGSLEIGDRVTHAPVYAFIGMIDELRISSQARQEFPQQ